MATRKPDCVAFREIWRKMQVEITLAKCESMNKQNFSQQLKEWFFLHRRLLPWRENPSPYEVWVSEVMLQQTQVSVVIPYFQRWMESFPSIRALSEAREEKVIKVWEGLGYYSRARNLHSGARYLTDNHGGELPSTYDELSRVKGLGPYTIGAILSFAFKQKAPAIDGNVLRVVARYFSIEEEVDKRRTQKKIEELTLSLLPDREPWIVMEALIELGALICQKRPSCPSCPLKEGCSAYREGRAELLPNRKKRPEIVTLHRAVALITTGRELLMRKGEAGKVMADLWEFPYFDRNVDLEKALGLSLTSLQKFPEVTHGFTRYRATLYPELFQAEHRAVKNFSWVSYKEVEKKALSSGHRRILELLKNRGYIEEHGAV
ncbi:MAG: Adenine DNA glycosylase [Chlamydiae bacterium]|nr:Adenine DNA glycosylase [Chlamydiota bacterium]